MVTDTLAQVLRMHRDRHAPDYPPHGHSDHGPMVMLALSALGVGEEAVLRYGERYRGRLVAQHAPARPLGDGDWLRQQGDTQAYASLLAYFDRCFARDGWQATLARCLPPLASGWLRGAFHPLIRMGYGIEFGVESEIAAGLAYLVVCGADPALARHARAPAHVATGGDYLCAMAALRPASLGADTSFGARVAQVLADAPLQPPRRDGLDATLRTFGAACLGVFDADHDFFALHMLTGSHAFRLCAPWIGPDAEALYGTGIAAAYLAIGAPPFVPIAGDASGMPPGRAAVATMPPWQELLAHGDEHDIKLAHSGTEQARFFADAAYTRVAASYLAPRLRAGSVTPPG